MSKPTFTELLENLTGYDEDAITERFGYSTQDLVGEIPLLRSTRALLFAQNRRAGMTDEDAYKAVMEMSNAAVTDCIVSAEDDPTDGEDGTSAVNITPAGKDSSPSA